MAKTVKEVVTSIGMKRVISYIDKDPDTNIPKILDWLENHDLGGGVIKQVKSIKETIKNKDNNWYRLIKSLWTDVDGDVRRKLFENFVINASMIGTPKQNKMKAKYSCNVPWAILLDPTSACNLHCIGCWAAEYGNKLNLTYEELNDIVVQGKKLGTYFYIFSGGEPLVRKDDIIKLCKQHNDCAFLSFTNGTLIDEKFADEMLKVKNFIPAISIEGFEEDTDFRRGKGTFNKVVRATEILKAKKLPFGFSCCYTSKNVETIGSEDYFNFMVNIGAKFAWFFTYIPVGKDAVVDLMVTPEQRKKMYHVIRDFRKTKPLFTLDFWNDGEFVNGCIAGGRSYLHINANGDIEPCAFIHYADKNIHNDTILEALQGPLFTQYKLGQPFNSNLLRPCPLLDNPEKLEGMVEKSKAKSTDLESLEDVHVLCGKCKQAASKWAPVADILWANTIKKKIAEENQKS